MLAIGVPALRGLTQLMAQLKAAKALLGDGTGGLSFCDEQLEVCRVVSPLSDSYRVIRCRAMCDAYTLRAL